QLAELVVEVGDGPGRVRILEADRRRPPLDLPRVHEGREATGDVVEDAFATFLLALDAFPVLADATRGPRLDFTEDVRMAGDELGVDRAGDLLEIALAALGEQQREKIDLEEQVSELVEQLRRIAGLSRVGDLVGLLDRVRNDRPRGLLAVPRAVAPQPLGQLLQLEQRA